MAQHLYVVIKGGYTTAALSGEVWQFGVRCRLSNAAPDPYGNLPTDIDFEPAEVARQETDWDIASNFVARGPLGMAFDPADFLNDQVQTAADRFIKTPTIFPTQVEVREASVYAMEGGRVAVTAAGPAKATLTYLSNRTPKGIGATGMLPIENTVVVSWETNIAGRRGRGRIYAPVGLTNSVETTTGLLTSTRQNNYLTAGQELVRDLRWANPLGQNLYVDPIVTGQPFTKYGRITGVRVGNMVDTQRRRRAQIQETYVSGPAL